MSTDPTTGPMFTIDHVILAVADLDAAAGRLLKEHGLASVVGGRHPGHGTGNRIVPLGPNYLELMAVLDPDEAATSPLGRWVTRRAGDGLAPAALCLRTDHIDRVAARLHEDPLPMTRERPDGEVLAWSLAGLGGMLGPQNLPFFIRWEIDPALHPARTPVPHRVVTGGITAAHIGPVGAELGDLLAGTPGVVIEDGDPGVHAVTIAMGTGEIVLATHDGTR